MAAEPGIAKLGRLHRTRPRTPERIKI